MFRAGQAAQQLAGSLVAACTLVRRRHAEHRPGKAFGSRTSVHGDHLRTGRHFGSLCARHLVHDNTPVDRDERQHPAIAETLGRLGIVAIYGHKGVFILEKGTETLHEPVEFVVVARPTRRFDERQIERVPALGPHTVHADVVAPGLRPELRQGENLLRGRPRLVGITAPDMVAGPLSARKSYRAIDHRIAPQFETDGMSRRLLRCHAPHRAERREQSQTSDSLHGRLHVLMLLQIYENIRIFKENRPKRLHEAKKFVLLQAMFN